MPCVWSTARPVVRDYLENIIALEAIQDLQPSELNELYDMLDWVPSATSSADELRDKKSLLAWIVRNMPELKADNRRVESAALLKQSMQLRGVDVATPASSKASSRPTSEFPQSPPSQREVTPSPATSRQPILRPPFKPTARTATGAAPSQAYIAENDEDEDTEQNEHDAIAHDTTDSHHPVAAAPPSTPSSFYLEIRDDLRKVARASKAGDHAAALQTLGELLGCVWIVKKVADVNMESANGRGGAVGCE